MAEIQGILIDKGLTDYSVPEASPTPKPSATKKSAKPQGTKSDSSTAVTDASLLGKPCTPGVDKKRKTIICIANNGGKQKGTWKPLATQNSASESGTATNG